MLSCCRGVRAAKTGRDDRPSFGDENMPRAEALERFDRLRVREVYALRDHTASTFLVQFQSTAASLEPDERIKLVVYAHKSMKFLKAVLSDSQANKICSLKWWYDGKKDVNSIVPLLTNSCPELASLDVCFNHYSVFDLVSSLLEHSSNRIKVLVVARCTKGDFARFFAALGQSQVSAITLSNIDSPEFAQGLHEYLAKDLLVRLDVQMNDKQVPSEMMMSLAQCIRLAKLEMSYCEFSQSNAFTLPRSITKLDLRHCLFVGGFDWSFPADSNVRELDFLNVRGIDGFGGALVVHLRAKGLDKLSLYYCDFADETLAVVGVELGRIKKFYLESSNLNDASIKLIALALQSPNNGMKELRLTYDDHTIRFIESHLVSALRHPNCNLAELRLCTYEPEHNEAVKAVEGAFRDRIALFVLLQGRQVRRRYCPLRRLPVEMFRLVGKVLI
ncbi:hypothetical protein BASA81_006230 [Batrachochytrium salamandrivorans]|nr:hypothetical protein BASA81_006230 [Batrachochytrium salamandrivorans]